MRRVFLDTNAYTALMAGDGSIADTLNGFAAVMISPIVLGELFDGFLGGNRNYENRKILARFLEKPRTVTVSITAETSEWFAEIKRMLRRKGKPIPINDVWIAAACMEHGAHLLTYDNHLEEIDGLLRC